MNKNQYYRAMFTIAALWNWAISLTSLAIYKPFFRFFGMQPPQNPIWLQLFLGAVFLFGAGYFMIGMAPQRNRDLAVLGILGKWAVFLIFIIYTIKGFLHPVFLAMGGVDFIFSLLFLEYLLRYPHPDLSSFTEQAHP